MPIAGGTVTEQVTSRWRAIDPLLPAPGTLPPGCGAELAAAEGGAPAATGACTHWAAEPGSLEATWGAARQYQLTAHAGGPDPGRGLDRLLTKWRTTWPPCRAPARRTPPPWCCGPAGTWTAPPSCCATAWPPGQ